MLCLKKQSNQREIECLYGYIQNIISYYTLLIIRAHISSTSSMLVLHRIESFRYASAFSTPHLMRLTFMLFNKCFKVSKFYCTIYTKCLK